jgi:hypothetical protein
MNIDAAFRCVYGREAKPEETARFNRIAKELDIRDNDAIWAVAFLLGHHLDLTKQIPAQMLDLMEQSLRKYETSLQKGKEKAEADLAAAKARVQETVSRAVAESAQNEIARAAQSVAKYTARKSWLRWLGSAAVCGMLFMGAAFFWGYHLGSEQGYNRAADEKAVTSWATTRLGKAAFAMDRSGALQALVACDRPGWSIERSVTGKDRLCIVRETPDGGVVGWVLP